METAKPQRRIGRLSEIGRVATRHGFGYMIDRRRSNDNTQLADRGAERTADAAQGSRRTAGHRGARDSGDVSA